jgi:putative nucleotidyltransferase-like protein
LEIPARAKCTPETELLLSCARPQPVGEAADPSVLLFHPPVNQLAGNVQDWDLVVTQAQKHRVLPILFSRLAEMGAAVPAAVQERLRAENQLNVFHNLRNAAELIGVLKAFDIELIPAMPFKGAMLGMTVYGNLTRRPFGDLDLLIHYRDLKAATAILVKRGYELKTKLRADGTMVSPDTEYQFARQADGMEIELRWRMGHNLGMDWAWRRRQNARLAGVEVPNLDPESTLLVLCIHGTKHEWCRLFWICDVAQLLATFPSLNWKKVIDEAKRVGHFRVLALGVLLARRVSGVAVPQDVLRRFEADSSACKQARYFQETLHDAQGNPPPGAKRWKSSQLLGFRDGARLLMSRDFLRPNEKDRAAVHLPESLDSLYYLVRIFRLIRKRFEFQS